MTLLIAELTFNEELVLALVGAAVPTAILVFGGGYLLNLFELAKKKREQGLELARFVREKQYEALAELYSFFGEFMRIYRAVNSEDTDLSDNETRRDLFEQAAKIESRVDALILRIASEFTHDNRDELEKNLAELRQSVQIWRECIRDGQTLPFTHSGQPDYVRFKNAFTSIATSIANMIYRSLDAPELSPDAAKSMLMEIFDNKHERHGAHDI